MSLGNTEYGNSKLIILRPITRDANKHEIPPTFQVSRLNDEGKYEKAETVTTVTGDITKVETYKKDWNGDISQGFKILMRDEEASEAYLIDCRFNFLNRDLINKILNLKDFKNVSISLYKNKKGFNSTAVKVGSELIGWKYSFEEIPKADEVINPRTKEVIQRDYSIVDEFFVNSINEFIEKNNLQGKDSPVTSKTSPSKVEDIEDDMDWPE